MRTRVLVFALATACAPHGPAEVDASPTATRSSPPPTRREDVFDELHGVRVPDPYRWLERADDPAVVAWTRAQDAHARDELARIPGRDRLRARLEQLMRHTAVSVPRRHGTRLFFSRRAADRDRASVIVREDDGRERVLLDPDRLDVSIVGVFPSPDGRRLAYKTSRNNADAASLHVLDVDSGREHTIDRIDGARYAVPSWTPDGRGFFYVGLPTDPAIPAPELPGRAELRFHALGDDPAHDDLVHRATLDPTTFLAGELSYDGRFLLITISRGFDSTDIWFVDRLRDPTRRVPLSVGTPHRTDVIAHAGALYLHTNDGAPRGRVMRVDPDRPSRADWTEIVPETDATLQGVAVVGGRLALTWLRLAHTELELRSLAGAPIRRMRLPQMGTSDGLVGRPDADEAYVGYSSFTTPPRIDRVALDTGATTPWHAVEIPADTTGIAVRQVVYTSADGTAVTMFLVHRDDLRRDGSHPTMLTGYGGFGVSVTPQFRGEIVAWVERGGVWAVPNLRGGGEYGEAWHEAGKRHNKPNVFDDFVAAAAWLVAEGYTSPGKLAIRGGSNGGLLVGAAMTRAAGMFGAVVCAVPLLDMVRYHRFGAGPTWTSEYGSADDPADFATLWSYSPYHRVSERTVYPPLLLLSADSDDRVDSMHARKFAAAVQATAGSHVLLRVERNAGHGGADSLAQAIDQIADTHAFVLAALE